MNKHIKITMTRPNIEKARGLIKDIATINGEHIPALSANISCNPDGADVLTISISMHAVDIVWEVGE